MRTIKLVFEYDGTDFCGFQKQKPAGTKTVQGTLEAALLQILQEPTKTAVAGRTDAGVHALANVVSFKTTNKMKPGEMKRALNAVLPDTIAVHHAEAVDEYFHARFSAVSRTYLYLILNREVRSPLLGRRVYHVKKPLHLENMHRAAAYLIGEKDFTTFCTSIKENDKRVRRINSIKIMKGREMGEGMLPLVCPQELWEDLIACRFNGNGFLRSMVRMMMAALVKVGTGKLSPEDIPRMLEKKDPGQVNASVPPWGLFLVNVEYGEGKVFSGEK
jgi:tRNA pseudouridine38-40 synthase